MIWAPLRASLAASVQYHQLAVDGEGDDIRGLRQREPQHKDELEGVVEGEPVGGADGALDHASGSQQ